MMNTVNEKKSFGAEEINQPFQHGFLEVMDLDSRVSYYHAHVCSRKWDAGRFFLHIYMFVNISEIFFF